MKNYRLTIRQHTQKLSILATPKEHQWHAPLVRLTRQLQHQRTTTNNLQNARDKKKFEIIITLPNSSEKRVTIYHATVQTSIF